MLRRLVHLSPGSGDQVVDAREHGLGLLIVGCIIWINASKFYCSFSETSPKCFLMQIPVNLKFIKLKSSTMLVWGTPDLTTFHTNTPI